MGLFKKSKEKQLRQDIRKGLRKNESISVSSDGVVTGGGGDKVKRSGRGRRQVAKKIAAEVTAGANFDNATVTAKVNRPKNKIVSKVPVSGSSVSETRTNNRGTVINKTTETVNSEKTKSKRPSKFRADYGITRNTDEVDNRKTTFTPGSISKSGMGTANEFSFRVPKSISNPMGVQSTNIGGMMAESSAASAERASIVDNFGRGGMYQGSDKKAGFQFQMRGNSAFKQLTGKGDPNQVLSMRSPLNDKRDGEEHEHTTTTSSQQKVDVGGGVTRTDDLNDSSTIKKNTFVKDPNQATGADLDYYTKEKSRCEKNPSAKGCSGFNKPNITETNTSSVNSTSNYPITKFEPGKNVVTGELTPASSSNESAPDGIVETVKPSSNTSTNTDRNKLTREQKKANRKQGRLDKQGGGTNCRMVCDD